VLHTALVVVVVVVVVVIVERANGYLETSFLPGRSFTSPADFDT